MTQQKPKKYRFFIRFVNWMKMQWEIFQFVDSVEANSMLEYQIEEKIKTIKKKYENT